MNVGDPSSSDPTTMASNRLDPSQTFSLRLGNVPVQIQSRTPLGRSVSNIAQGFLPNFATSNLPGNAPTLSSMRITEPSAVVNMPAIDSRGNEHVDHSVTYSGHGYGHNHSHNNNHGHGHSHSHMVPMQDENQNNNGGLESTNSTLNELQQHDWRPFLVWFQKSGIFFVLLFIKLMYDHRLGLLVFFALGGTFYYANMRLVQFIHQSAVRENRALLMRIQPLWLMAFMAANIAILFYVFQDQEIWRLLILKMPVVKEVDIWTLLWIVLLTDYIIKFGTVILKALISTAPQFLLLHKRRGKYYMFVEQVSHCYRHMIPVIPWIHFLSDDQDSAHWFSILCIILYCLFKGIIFYGMGGLLIKAFNRLRSPTNFGSKPSASDLKTRGDQCPICQDVFKEPVMLICKHIFCENCVSVWFDRERTCPMCRAQITENPMFQDGSTSPHLQWY